MNDVDSKHFHRPNRLELGLIAVSLVVTLGHVLGALYYWYERFLWLDAIVHFAGGAWVAFAVFAFISSLRRVSSYKKLVLSLALITLVAGIGWEILEFAIEKHYLIDFQGPPLDTLADLIIGTLGGGAAALYIKSSD